ncbi:0acf0048-c05d-4f22-aeb0-f0b24d211cd6 [Thermothielavioides terrestris]|nr:0acf0048-c05d-4f22-aeb0-f0b24d211cd6 [Thermothielavioides terrestris]
MGGSTGYGGYYQDTSATGFPTTAMPQGAMGYHHSTADYGQPDSRQTQSFGGTYTPTMMYNVQQTGGPQGAAVYDASQQFPSRQAAGLPMMATDVTAPYFSSEPANTPAPSTLQAQTASSSATPVYQQPGLHGYSTGGMAAIGGMAAQSTPAAEVRMEEEYPAAEGLDEAYAAYQSALKEIFQNIRNGVLAEASESLLNVSNWLLSHVVDLGLTSDDQNLHGERIKMWNDFNHAWLAICQRQKEMMESGQQLQRSQSLIPREGLEKMGKELVKLCDGIERHGLVDYQYGVWEEQIVDILEQCLDLYEPPSASPAGGGGGGEGSSNNRRR